MLNLEGRIGGDAGLSYRGQEYARKLTDLVRESVGVSSYRFKLLNLANTDTTERPPAYRLDIDDLQNILLTSARHLDRNIQLLERGGQGPDHPVHPAIVETRYIKSITCRLLPNT